MIKLKEIISSIEKFAPLSLQEGYDNAGLQVGDPEMTVSACLLCLDVTEEILTEAKARNCNLIVSHHPLLFKGLKQVTGANTTQRIVIDAIRNNIAIYSAHTNLDSAHNGVSFEMGEMIGITRMEVLDPKADDPETGLGVIGDLAPTPVLEFLRNIKETFKVKMLKYTAHAPKLVVRRVALCGGAGASFIGLALRRGADAFVSADFKYHDFTTYAPEIILADIGHFESERCSGRIFSRIIREMYPDMVVYFSETEKNPVKYM